MVMTAEGVKSIPLQQFPAEAWTSIFESIGGSTQRVIQYYETVPWLFRGVNARSDAVASLPLAWEVDGQEEEKYTLPFDLDVPHFLNELEGDLTLFGAAYVWLDAGKPLYLRKPARLYPGSIKPVFDKMIGLKEFERTVGGNKVTLSLDEVGWIWLPNRKKELGPGTPPGQAALRSAGVLGHIDAYIEKFFEQGTISPTIIGIEDGTEDQDVERLEGWFKRRIQGIANAFGAVAVRGSIKPYNLGQNELNKLSLKPLNDQKREDISTALGVPQTMLFSNAANYATANQDAFNWYELTIVPEAMRLQGPLNKFLFNPIGVSCLFKPERLEMYQEREADKASKMVTFYDRSIVTKNEVRKQAGWAPMEDGDVTADESTTPETPSQQAKSDLRAWRSKAVKRLKAGRPMTFGFESTVIDPDTTTWIKNTLPGLTSVESIGIFFDEIIKGIDHDQESRD